MTAENDSASDSHANRASPKHKQAVQDLSACFTDVIPELEVRAEIYQVPDFCLKEEIFQVFAEDLPCTVASLETACAASDEMAIRRHGHSLEGMGGMVGFAVLSVVGGELCKAARAHVWDRCAALTACLRRWCITQGWTKPKAS